MGLESGVKLEQADRPGALRAFVKRHRKSLRAVSISLQSECQDFRITVTNPGFNPVET